MSDSGKITSTHLCRCAFVYIRQSSPQQVERNRESTALQYRLVERAIDLGWRREQVSVFDEDLGISADGIAQRSGFAHMASEVALARVGIVLGIEVSRLARNNADWYRLLDLCGVTDTLIADADGIYHPALFNDRLLLGLKGTMSEAESCTSCAPGSMAASATKPPAASCAVVFRSASCGASRTARCSSIPTKR